MNRLLRTVLRKAPPRFPALKLPQRMKFSGVAGIVDDRAGFESFAEAQRDSNGYAKPELE